MRDSINFRSIRNLFSLIIVVLIGLSQSVTSNAEVNNGVINKLEHINWSKSGDAPFQPFNASNLPANEANLVFIRPIDNDDLQTSANIAIDGRFQVSLQPGHFSQIRYCSGNHIISVAPTGMKVNDLTSPFSHNVNIEPKQNHYIYVEVDDANNQPKLSKLNEVYAKDILSNQKEQTHQISRVVRDCPPVVEAKPEVKVEIDKPINLEVLFEFDKAVIQPVFNQRIEAVAKFMHKYPNTRTILEGHTDSKGSDIYNMDLSKRRADAVKQELVTKYDVAADRLSTVGYGETRPVDTNSTPKGRYKNRRVVATVSANK